MSDELTEAEMDAWPNCAVPDCEYKACLRLWSDCCYPHTLGLTPPKPDEYFGAGE